MLTFRNPVFNAADSKQVGRDSAYCIRIRAPGSYECNWTIFLENGHIVVEGPFFGTRDSVLAITGGKGAYRDARRHGAPVEGGRHEVRLHLPLRRLRTEGAAGLAAPSDFTLS